MNDQGIGGATVLSNRQRKLNSKRIRAEQATLPRPEPAVREVYEKPEIKHADDQIIPGLSGRGAILRADNLKKLWDAGKLNAIQYSAGLDFVAIVEDFYASVCGLAKLSERAGRVGGSGDPIARYIKGRPARTNSDGKVVGYIPTQRPRNPSGSRSASDGWTHAKLDAMARFSRIARLVERMPRDHRAALCVLVLDPDRPYLPALTISAATRRLFGYKDTNTYAKLTRWLAAALDEIEPEVHTLRMAA